MSRISRGCVPAGRNAVAGAAPAMLRRGRVIGGVPSGEGEEILDLLSRTRRGCSNSSSGESDVLNRMEKKVSVGLAKAGRGAAEEFLSAEIGKNDYDWLLTPPGTPLFSSVDSTDRQPPSSSQRSSSNLRSSLIKPSRLSVPHSDNRSYAPTTARSSSTTRTSLSNTITSSVNSRPTTPNNRTRPPATAAVPRPSTPRSTTPARSRPVATAQTSRPSTPTTRPSTPTRRPPPPPPVSTSRPSSPARSRTPVQLPERPVSAGRRGNSNVEVLGSGVSSSRRPSSPAVARGRVVAENQGKGRVKMAENQKPVAPEKKPVVPEKKQVTVKPALGGEAGGYGRTLSKNSLNMAIKHMDIRQGMNGMRGVSLFPHSIRSTAAAAVSTIKNPPASRAAPPPPSHKNRSTNHTSFITEPIPKNYNKGSSERDSIHLKEDERALNWLQSVDERHLFDRRFDPLPEPFILM